MSDKPIQRGDLVMVVRPSPCCGHADAIGTVFSVARVGILKAHCIYCMQPFMASVAVSDEYERVGFLLPRLIRIDPPVIKDDVPTAEELTV